jgi:glucose-6-phosphate isomerase
MLEIKKLLSSFDPATAVISGADAAWRRLSDLFGCFSDLTAYKAAMALDDALVYSVASSAPADGEGDMHYGAGLIMPGRIGREYFMTKGHLHVWREAAELYIGLSGGGVILMEDESTGESRLAPLQPNHTVYVPGHTAHRTINTGSTPLTYLGIYPAKAGLDYSAIAKKNFRCVVIERNGKPVMVERRSISK